MRCFAFRRAGSQGGSDDFHDWPLLEPGLVHLPLWRPENPADIGEHPESSGAYGGLARKG
ncbi:hypothetical protein [Nocardia sp. NPDC051570]|uniref:hypothetical protein n=1 Tax=Nocardia sp. NPDC051570 TaxID=3364324 RepID=UPI003799A4CB